MTHSVYIECICGAPIGAVAEVIAKALDSDLEGEYSWTKALSSTGTAPSTHLKMGVWVTPPYADAIMALYQYPELLQETCARDFQTRFPTLLPPSLDECIEFCNSSYISKNGEWLQAPPVLMEIPDNGQ